ncbi:MAG: uracil-DNA glycosylase, family 4 [Candidatus Nitrotoga sp. SPKER]|nr:MAG: uracil-DNA glycosylase, family 4 [Candidatus Nitrotoga sp. SPKER]
MKFSTTCRLCPRLANFLDEVRQTHPDYYACPVPSFGDAQARLLIVGLAPGMHGANRTGRPFTGDFAGKLLYSTLYRFGFASQAEPLNGADNANPELSLNDCRITNAVRCLPPQNKPEPAEVRQCNQYLVAELVSLPVGAVVLALGAIAHFAVLRALDLKIKDYKFSHGMRHVLPNGIMLYDSYHCSRYNTQTKRLTEAMFHAVFSAIVLHLHSRDLA